MGCKEGPVFYSSSANHDNSVKYNNALNVSPSSKKQVFSTTQTSIQIDDV